MIIDLIRHGATPGNLQKRYIGVTDEELSPEGIAGLQRLKPFLRRRSLLIVSPLIRCIRTAEILFPGQDFTICRDFRECDFGDFENHNYLELSGHPDYQRWIDSNGTARFPGGEDPADFKRRTVRAFRDLILNLKNLNNPDNLANPDNLDITIIAHGGTIMAILEQFAVPAGDYYDYQLPNACAYRTKLEFPGNPGNSENSEIIKLHILTKIVPDRAINC